MTSDRRPQKKAWNELQLTSYLGHTSRYAILQYGRFCGPRCLGFVASQMHFNPKSSKKMEGAKSCNLLLIF